MIKKSSISVMIISLLLILILGFILGYQNQKQHVLKNSANIEKATDSENESVLLYSEGISEINSTNNDTIDSTLSDDIANSENTLSVDITPNNENLNINDTATTENSVSNNTETNQPANNTEDNTENSDTTKQDKSIKEQNVQPPSITGSEKESTAQNTNSSTNKNVTITNPNTATSKPVIEEEKKQTTNENKTSSSTTNTTANNTTTKPSTDTSSNVNISNSTNSSTSNSSNNSNIQITITNKNDKSDVSNSNTNTNTSTNVTISSGDSISEIETLIFNKINEERSKMGLPKLSNSTTAAKYAREKSKDMATRNYFDHYCPEGTLVYNKMLNDGIKFTAWAENLGYISSSKSNDSIASTLMTNWMNSPGHKANILSTAYTHVGIGVYKINGEIYATQEFLSF